MRYIRAVVPFNHNNTPSCPIVNPLLGLMAYKGKIMGFRENLKSELAYLDMPVKELAAKSGINKLTIDHWLSAKGKIPLLDKGVKIAQVLGVSVEYLVNGKDSPDNTAQKLSNTSRHIAQLAERLDEKKRGFVLDFIKWLSLREDD
jgi:transcriptional regulator with XRE-family HTH domain